MSFIDEVKVFFKAGDGGDGCSSFRREKFVEFGGPDGGNGGRGGDITLIASNDINTLMYFRYNQHIKAKNGASGRKMQRTGVSGESKVIKVPIGTQIMNLENEVLADLSIENQVFTLARGGAGGAGNMNYKTSTNQAPRHFTHGKKGEELWVWLKLKIISDVGIIGMPNSGKSTFLVRCSNSKSKVDDYPFTTLEPHLGIVVVDSQELVIADIPGLIADAHLGVGLGHKFLKHIERCKILLHLVDCMQDDVVSAYQCVRNELMLYSDTLVNKEELVALSRCDIIDDQDLITKKQKELMQYSGKNVVLISFNQSLENVLKELAQLLHKKYPPRIEKRIFDPFISK